jgi:uncharacterized membrane protein
MPAWRLRDHLRAAASRGDPGGDAPTLGPLALSRTRRPDQPDAYGRELLSSLVRAQAGVSLAILLPAISLLALYPLLAVLVPRLATLQVLGFPLTLVILGGGIYPPLVLLGYWYVRRAERLEQRFVELLKEQ